MISVLFSEVFPELVSGRAQAGLAMAFGGWGQAVVRRIGAVIYTGIQNSTLIYYRDASVPRVFI
jgi:hypothetical protein